MKALVRTTTGYKWVKVDLNQSAMNTDTFIDVNGTRYYPQDIICFNGDFRKGKEFFVCYSCNKLIEKEKWNEHVATIKEKADCFKCNNMRRGDEQIKWSASFKKNDDGTVTQKSSVTFVPKCRTYSYSTYDCDYSKSCGLCKYYRCENGKAPYNPTVFVKYPKFKCGKNVTVSALVKNGWHNTPGNPNFFQYKKRNLYAMTDKYGVVINFRYNSKRGDFYFYYSQYYDKIFVNDGSSYCEDNLRNYVSDSIYDYIIRTIKKLWN